MKDNLPYAEINIANVPADGNIGGMIFAAATAMIFFWGIPLVRYMFPAAILLGCGVALVLHFVRRETPGASAILSAANPKQ
jgi:sugar phosphate permease